jgi:hypothetical protein
MVLRYGRGLLAAGTRPVRRFFGGEGYLSGGLRGGDLAGDGCLFLECSEHTVLGRSLLGLKNCTIRCLLLRFRSSFPSPISLPWRCSRRNMVGCSQTREAGALHAGRYINRPK